MNYKITIGHETIQSKGADDREALANAGYTSPSLVDFLVDPATGDYSWIYKAFDSEGNSVLALVDHE